MRECPNCKVEQSLEMFRVHRVNGEVQYKKDGVTPLLKGWCRPCERVRKKAVMKARWAADETGEEFKAYWRNRHYVKTYGITLDEFNAMLVSQGGRCAICRTDTPGGKGQFNVDHCHGTGRVRGILCERCNRRLLAAAGDDPELLRRAADYLEGRINP